MGNSIRRITGKPIKARKSTIVLFGMLMMVYSCSSVHQNEKARFLHAIKKDIPFKTDNFREIGHQTYAFDNADGIVQPDYEINNYGERFVARTTFGGEVSQRTDSTFWRNLYFNNRRHRLICVDRLSIQGEAKGLVYVMQMKSKRWPKEGTYNWDVTDRRNMQSAANVLDDYEKLTLRAMNSDVMPDVELDSEWYPQDVLADRDLAPLHSDSRWTAYAQKMTDSINLSKICHILDARGFVGRKRSAMRVMPIGSSSSMLLWHIRRSIYRCFGRLPRRGISVRKRLP